MAITTDIGDGSGGKSGEGAAGGKGTFVMPDAQDNRIGRLAVSNIDESLSYLNMVGQRTMLRVVNLDRGEMTPRICFQMGITATSEVVRAIRIRDLDGAPLVQVKVSKTDILIPSSQSAQSPPDLPWLISSRVD